MRVNFGPWAPDSASVDVPVLAEARNVFPYAAGYGPIPSLEVFSTEAFGERVLGMISAKTSAGAWVVYAGGPTTIKRLDDQEWTDVSRLSGGAYNASESNLWSATQFGSKVIFGHLEDDAQVIDVDAGGANFAALGGTPPRARYWTTVGSFLVAASLGTDKRAVRNSAIENHEGWTVGTNLCDEQTFPNGGRVTGIVGGEFGYIVQERARRRMIFQPGQDYAFRYEQVDDQRGSAAGYSTVGVGQSIYFLSDDGFYSDGPAGLNPIGAEVVNNWFFDNSDRGRFFNVLGFSHPYLPIVGWAFYGSSTDTNYTRVILFNWKSNRWTYGMVEAQFWTSFATAGLTLEGLDAYGTMETLPASLDSPIWEGGQPQLAAINADGNLCFLSGSAALDALIRTSPMNVNSGMRSKNFNIKPLGVFNDATLAVRVGKQEHTKNSVSYTSAITPSTLTGVARCRAAGAIHTLELALTQSSGTRWTLTSGLDVEATPDGKK